VEFQADMTTFYTIGHSNRSSQHVIAMLKEVSVELLADVRTIPRSRHNPQFNAESFAASLADAGIAYCRMAELGGLRGRKKGGGPSRNGFWENDSFRNYADYAETDAFRDALERLRELGSHQRCAIMCAEAVWWRCHRRIISDYLIARGETVIHLMELGKRESAHLSDAAVIMPDGTLAYPGPRNTG
jgi:uncharacterized protein (DUF488 family)